MVILQSPFIDNDTIVERGGRPTFLLVATLFLTTIDEQAFDAVPARDDGEEEDDDDVDKLLNEGKGPLNCK